MCRATRRLMCFGAMCRLMRCGICAAVCFSGILGGGAAEVVDAAATPTSPKASATQTTHGHDGFGGAALL
eukprot:373605-Pyramimonas_sp.AAC.1